MNYSGNPDSSKNQSIKRKFVEREVHHCLSSLVYELSQKAEYFDDWTDDLYDAFCMRDFEGSIANHAADMDRDDCTEYLESLGHYVADGEPIERLREAVEANAIEEGAEDFCSEHNVDLEYRDIFEHWAVSDFLAAKLEAHGHKIIRDFFDFGSVWGRPTTGQAILLDGVISRICADMEILEGQRNEWEV